MGTCCSTCAETSGAVAGLLLPREGARSETYPLLEGDQGTEQTIALIRRAVRESLSDPAVRAAAAGILQGVPAHDDLAEARRLYSWVLSNIRYTKDPVDHETVSNARWTLQNRIGDCDDINGVLLPALLMMAGHPVRLVTIANVPMAPDAFTHIYAEVAINGRWIPVDAAREGAAFGKGPATWYRKRIWELGEDRFQEVAGLGGSRVGMGGWVEDVTAIFQAGASAAGDIYSSIRGVPYTPPYVPSTTTSYPPAPQPSAPLVSGISNTVLLIAAAGLLFLLSRK